MKSLRTQKGKTLELSVVGLYYRLTPDDLDALDDMLPINVRLEREPNNPHDENAIKVVTGRRHIGYLARQVAAEVAPRMDEKKFTYEDAQLVEIEHDGGRGTIRMKVKKAGN